ncbi:MAG: NfeD family protein [Ruminococcaceae bacterium]|nr:NfeD family protein [Oscillospiraceae bacterium]
MLPMQILWLCVIIAAVVVEAFTSGLVSIWFVPSAFVSLILTVFDISTEVQIAVFVVLSACFLFAFKLLSKRRIKKGAKLNLDAIIGEKAVVVDKIQNIAGSGQVKVHNQIWSARSSDPDVIFEEGDVVSVVAIEGVKLICK